MSKTPKTRKRSGKEGSSSELEKDIAYRRFIEIWLSNGFNGTKAVKELWPHLANKSAEVKASRLLCNDKILTILSESTLSLEDLKKCFITGMKIAISKGDLTNYQRAIENLVRMMGGFKDVVESKNEHSFVSQKEKDELAELRQGIHKGRSN